MNARTAQLINSLASGRKIHPKALKRIWNRCPRNKRHELRKEMESRLD